MKRNTALIIGILGIAIVAIIFFMLNWICSGLTNTEAQIEQQPTITPTITTIPTPLPIVNVTSKPSPSPTVSGNQTPVPSISPIVSNNVSDNFMGINEVDYSSLINMYPWMKSGYNDSSPYPWMWSPEKFSREFAGQGFNERRMLYDNYVVKNSSRTPALKLEILNRDGSPYTYHYNNAYYRGDIVEGIFRISNVGDKPYQGDIDIVMNATLHYNNGLYNMQPLIKSVFVSSYPGGSPNDFDVSWEVPSMFMGSPLYDGAYEVYLELRDKSNGHTLYSLHLTPQLASDKENGGSFSNHP